MGKSTDSMTQLEIIKTFTMLAFCASRIFGHDELDRFPEIYMKHTFREVFTRTQAACGYVYMMFNHLHENQEFTDMFDLVGSKFYPDYLEIRKELNAFIRSEYPKEVFERHARDYKGDYAPLFGRMMGEWLMRTLTDQPVEHFGADFANIEVKDRVAHVSVKPGVMDLALKFVMLTQTSVQEKYYRHFEKFSHTPQDLCDFFGMLLHTGILSYDGYRKTNGDFGKVDAEVERMLLGQNHK